MDEPRAAVEGYRGDPRPKATDRNERAAQRLNRLLGFALVVSLCLNVLCVVTIYSLFPLVRVQPALIQFSDRQFFRIEPVFAGTRAELKAREAFARRYVTERETINLVNDFERWAWMRDQSHPKVWEPFLQVMQRDKTWDQMERDDLRQSVEILASWSLHDDPDRWAVEYERKQTRGYDVITRGRWVATMSFGYLPEQATNEELFDNPFRLRVDRYSISPKTAIEKGGQE